MILRFSHIDPFLPIHAKYFRNREVSKEPRSRSESFISFVLPEKALTKNGNLKILTM